MLFQTRMAFFFRRTTNRDVWQIDSFSHHSFPLYGEKKNSSMFVNGDWSCQSIKFFWTRSTKYSKAGLKHNGKFNKKNILGELSLSKLPCAKISVPLGDLLTTQSLTSNIRLQPWDVFITNLHCAMHTNNSACSALHQMCQAQMSRWHILPLFSG